MATQIWIVEYEHYGQFFTASFSAESATDAKNQFNDYCVQVARVQRKILKIYRDKAVAEGVTG